MPGIGTYWSLLESVIGAEEGATRAGLRFLRRTTAVRPGTIPAVTPTTSIKGNPDTRDSENRMGDQERTSKEIGRRSITRAIKSKRPATIAASHAIGPATHPHPPKDPNTNQASPWITAATRA